MVAVSPEKIATLFPAPKSRSIPSDNRTKGPRQEEPVCDDAVWIPLELDETRTTVAERSFASCNPDNKNETDNSFFQRNNFPTHVT